MNKKTAKCLVAAAMLTSVMTISHAADAADWERGEYITTGKNVQYDASTNNFSNYTGPNQGLIINWNPSGAPNGPTVNITAGSGETAQFAGNKAAGDVGASIFTDYNAKTIVQCAAEFTSNNAPGRAGAVWNNGTTEFVNNVVFKGNTVSNTDVDPNLNFGVGGAVVNLDIEGDAASGTMIFDKDVTFVGNSAAQAGAMLQSGSLTVKGNADFLGNTATKGDGGAVLSGQGGGASDTRTETYQNLTVSGNTAAGNGGGYAVSQGSSLSVTGTANFGTAKTVDGKEYTGNTATNGSGGAIYNEGTVELAASKFENNKATNGNGGAVYSTGENATANLGSTTMSGNQAKQGGAIAVTDGSTVTIGGGSSIKNNTATSGNGGAIYNDSTVILDTTAGNISFSGNTANSKANDIYAASGSTTEVSGANNVTIGSGLTAVSGSTVDIKGTSNLVIDTGAASTLAGIVKTENGASFVNKGTTDFTSTSKLSGNFVNEAGATMNISGTNLTPESSPARARSMAARSDEPEKIVITNSGIENISSTINADVTNNETGELNILNGGNLTGSVENNNSVVVSKGGSLDVVLDNAQSGTVTNSGTVVMAAESVVNGSFINNADATMTIAGETAEGQTMSLTNRGNAIIAAGSDVKGTVNNYNSLSVAGAVDAVVTNDGTTTVQNGGVLGGTITNNAQKSLTVDNGGSVTGTVDNKGSFTIAGAVDAEVTNAGTTTVQSGGVLGGTITNNAQKSLTVDNGGSLTGTVTNDGTLTVNGSAGNATTAVSVTNNGTANFNSTSKLSGTFTNNENATMTIAGTNATEDDGTAKTVSISNSGTENISGTINADVTNSATGVLNVLNGGNLTGSVENSNSVVVSNGGIMDVVLENAEGATVTNRGNATIAAGSDVKGTVNNYNSLSVAGAVDAVVTNDGTTTVQNGGVLGGTITNNAQKSLTVDNGGSVTGTVDNKGSFTIAGAVDAEVTNAGTTTVQNGGVLGGTITNNAQKSLTVDNGGSLTGTVANDGTLTVNGSAGNATTAVSVTNNGTANFNSTSSLNGSLINNEKASMTIAGESVSGKTIEVTNDGRLTFADGASVNANTQNNNELTVLSGAELTGSVINDKTLSIAGTVNAQVTNDGTTTVQSGGVLGGTIANNVEKSMTVEEGGLLTGNVTNDGTLTIDGAAGNETTAVSITNNAITNINGSFNGNIDQIYNEATTTFGANSNITVAEDGSVEVEGGTIIVENGASLTGVLTVTEAVDVQIRQEATTIVEKGLKVGNGVIAGKDGGMNLAKGNYIVEGNQIGTKLTIASSTINGEDGEAPLTIEGKGQLTLSDDIISGNAFDVEGDLILAPTKGGTLTLAEANAVSGNGNVTVDEIVITKQVYDQESGEYKEEVTHKGIGTVVLQNDNSEFKGNFLQKMGTVIAEAGAKFFGGTNTIETGSVSIQKGAELTAEETNVTGGTLNLADGAILGSAGTINILAGDDKFGTVNIYNAIKGNIEDETRPDQTIISASDINQNGALTYLNINADGEESTQAINLNGGVGLGLFNNTIIDGVESDGDTLLSLQSDAGVRHLTLGDGSGINASQITLGENTSLTYKDNASYFDVNEDDTSRNISLEENAALNFANNSSDVLYDRIISGVSSSTINKSGNGATIITTELTNFAGSINATGGSLDFSNTTDALNLNSITSNNADISFASENLATSGTLTVAGGSFTADGNITAGGAASITDAITAVAGDFTANDTLSISGGEFSVSGDVLADKAATITNSKTNIKGDLTASSDLTVNKGTLDVKGNVDVTGNASIAEAITSVAGTINAETLTINGGSITAQDDVTVSGSASITDAIASVAGDINVTDEISLSGSQLIADSNVEAGSASITDSVTNVAGDVSVLGAADISNSVLAVAGKTAMGDATVNSSSLILLGDSSFASLALAGSSSLNTPANVAVAGTMTLTGGDTLSDSPIINLTGNSLNEITADKVVVDGDSSIMFDATVRQKGLDTISANEVSGNGHLIITGINITDSPIDRMVNIDISELLSDKDGSKSSMVKLKDGGVVANTEMGKYLITASSSSNILNATLLKVNPQMYRGQVATAATYANQLIVNNMLFDHINILANDLLAREGNANRYAAINPLFAPYQYSQKDGDLWYKAYGSFERISMTQGLNVGNNAYGSIIGADFPAIALKKGWNLIPTGYIAYNGGHQTFNGVSMYQNGAQVGAMGTAYKGDLITSLLAYGGGYANHMTVNGPVGSGSDDTGNWFAGVASKTAYNLHLPADLILQPTALVSYNIFGNQNYHSDFGNMSMNAGFLNGINIAPGLNLIWNKKTFSLYATTQLVFNLMGDVSGRAGNVDLDDVRMRSAYFEYGLGAMKRINDIFTAYLQFTIRNGYRTGVGFQGGLNWKVGKNPKKQK